MLRHRLKDQVLFRDGKGDSASGASKLPRFGGVASQVIWWPVGDYQFAASWHGTTRRGGNFIDGVIPVGMVFLAIHGDYQCRRKFASAQCERSHLNVMKKRVTQLSISFHLCRI